MNLRLIFILFLWFGIQKIYSQEIAISVIGSAGDYKSISGYSLSWTLGETMTETFTKDDIHLTQGFQQPDLETESGFYEQQGEWSVSAYPNPVNQDLIISFQNIEESPLIHITITDIMGRIVILKELKDVPVSYEYRLNMEHLTRGIYILKVYTQDYRMQRLFKIEKQ